MELLEEKEEQKEASENSFVNELQDESVKKYWLSEEQEEQKED